MSNLLLGVLMASTLSEQVVSGGRFTSPSLAREFVHRMQGESLQAFASADPEQPGRFVAVLYVPEQLLVVHAAHPATSALEERIKAGQYREVYLDLQGTPTPQGRFFVLDAAADGLLAAVPGRGSVDMIDDGHGPSLLFNGGARGQHVSEAAYNQRVTAADQTYARLLKLLKSSIESRRTHKSSAGF